MQDSIEFGGIVNDIPVLKLTVKTAQPRHTTTRPERRSSLAGKLDLVLSGKRIKWSRSLIQTQAKRPILSDRQVNFFARLHLSFKFSSRCSVLSCASNP